MARPITAPEHKPGQDEPKPPKLPVSPGPEPDLPDPDDELHELIKPIET